MNKKLNEVLHTPMKTILAVRVCFEYCTDRADLEAVIEKIPKKFGEFEILLIDEEQDYFLIQNFFEKNGELKSQIVAYDFYHEGGYKDDF